MFQIAQVTGNGTSQELLAFGSSTEGSIHSGIVENTTGSEVTFPITIGGNVTYNIIAPVGTSNITFKMNVPATNAVTTTPPTGVKLTASYVELAIDPNAALNVAQQIIAGLPDAVVDDTSPSGTNVYSSQKVEALLVPINDDLINKQTQIDTKLDLAQVQATALYF